MKPAIGLDCDLKLRGPARRQRLEIWRSYADAVELAGGVPVILPTTENPGHIDEQLDVIDGLVLIGGMDLSPKFYGARKHPKTRTMHPSRQFYDIELARAAIRRRVPILAVCAGLQLVNVVCGGDLIQHLPDTLDPGSPHRENTGEFTHEVTVEPGSDLARIIAADRLTVNSSHHQAVGKVGAEMDVSARSSDGVIEALESKGEAFLMCVQWHPERLAAGHPQHLALFEALVEASGEEPEAA